MLVSLTITTIDITNLIFVEYKYYNQLQCFSSNEKFLAKYSNRKELNKLTNDDLSKLRSTEKHEKITELKYNIITQLIPEIIWFIFSSIFFLVHFFKILKQKAVLNIN
jgi:hypothetical protein